MTSELNEKVNQMRSKTWNKSCFECGEKGTNYVIIDFGVFVCNSCSGVHRQLNHKAKGVGMCNFTEKDVETLEKWGNKNAKEYWMSDWNKTLYPIPDKSNTI